MPEEKLVPPKGVQAACRRGLELAPKFGGPGLTAGARARARAMADGQAVTLAQRKRMGAFFSRHRQSRADPGAAEPTPGAVAWLLWGGDAGRDWANAAPDSAQKSMAEPDEGLGDRLRRFLRGHVSRGTPAVSRPDVSRGTSVP